MYIKCETSFAAHMFGLNDSFNMNLKVYEKAMELCPTRMAMTMSLSSLISLCSPSYPSIYYRHVHPSHLFLF